MKVFATLVMMILQIIFVENGTLPQIVTWPPDLNNTQSYDSSQEESNLQGAVVLKKSEESNEDSAEETERQIVGSGLNKPCTVVVLSSAQNLNMQSLLRKYRYDSKGKLIRNSVQYFIKTYQGEKKTPVLVPLNSKSFTPLGGFIRYYKEVPPIPHAWQH